MRVIRNDEPKGLVVARNQGATGARGRYLAFLDPDAIPRESWLTALVHAAESHADVAVVGSKVLDAAGAIRHAGVVFSREELLDILYPHGESVVQKAVDVHIHNIRKKLGDDGARFLQTVRSFGYRLARPHDDDA